MDDSGDSVNGGGEAKNKNKKEKRQKDIENRIPKPYDRVLREDKQRIFEGKLSLLEGRLEVTNQQLEAHRNHIKDLENKVKSWEDIQIRVKELEQLITEKDGIVAENQKLSEENAKTKMTVTTYESRLEALETDREELLGELREIVAMYDDLQDRLYEVDRSWRNNLIFHGIKIDENGLYENSDCLENKVKAVIRTKLSIGRDIPVLRAQRIYYGSDIRGHKPVLINFLKWSDKEEVLRKSKILKNSGITVEEDFSRAAKNRRKELEKLVKEVKNLSPEKKCVLKYDKLIIDDKVYVYNDVEGRIEKLPYTTANEWIDDEVGDATVISRRLRSRLGPANVAARRAQSVECVLEKIPNVGPSEAGAGVTDSPKKRAPKALKQVLNGKPNGKKEKLTVIKREDAVPEIKIEELEQEQKI